MPTVVSPVLNQLFLLFATRKPLFPSLLLWVPAETCIDHISYAANASRSLPHCCLLITPTPQRLLPKMTVPKLLMYRALICLEGWLHLPELPAKSFALAHAAGTKLPLCTLNIQANFSEFPALSFFFSSVIYIPTPGLLAKDFLGAKPNIQVADMAWFSQSLLPLQPQTCVLKSSSGTWDESFHRLPLVLHSTLKDSPLLSCKDVQIGWFLSAHNIPGYRNIRNFKTTRTDLLRSPVGGHSLWDSKGTAAPFNLSREQEVPQLHCPVLQIFWLVVWRWKRDAAEKCHRKGSWRESKHERNSTCCRWNGSRWNA
ncbi:PREDICTED: uncharacterized protein LOC105597643 [Cercocebus atys]|uniref:uncharacterized protein LOC105597643 n=1 Tax=Cercocebus atys TaxID=9531 RepID=UPI0005F4C3E9|nr:PREDICTED: uncharacterized protein LOC105597643 [Cercocebus atys]